MCGVLKFLMSKHLNVSRGYWKVMHIIKFARANISSYVGFVITAGEQECTQNKQDFSISVGGKRTI